MKQANVTITQVCRSKKSALLLLEGELVLGNLDLVREKIISTIEQYNTLQIVVKNAENIDLTCIQLLFALKKSLQTLQKQFSFDIELPEEVKVVLTHAGFNDLPALLAAQATTVIKEY